MVDRTQFIKNTTSVMIWSVISAKRMGRLYVVEAIMQQHQYWTVLETKLILQLQERFNRSLKVFMQDWPTCNTAKKSKFSCKKEIFPFYHGVELDEIN